LNIEVQPKAPHRKDSFDKSFKKLMTKKDMKSNQSKPKQKKYNS